MTWSLVGSLGTIVTTTANLLTVPAGQPSAQGNLLVLTVGIASSNTNSTVAPLPVVMPVVLPQARRWRSRWVAQPKASMVSSPAGWTLRTNVASATPFAKVWVYDWLNNPGNVSSAILAMTTLSGRVVAQFSEWTCPGVSGAQADQTGTLTQAATASPANIVTSGNLQRPNELAIAAVVVNFSVATSTTLAPGAGFTEASNFDNGVSAGGHVAFDYELDTGSSAGATVTDAETLSTTGAGNIAGAIATYLQPPTDTDTASGADGGESISILINDSDTASGSDFGVVGSGQLPGIRYVQTVVAGGSATAVTTLTLTVPGGTTTKGGDTLVLSARGGTSTDVVTAVADSRGNTWTVDKVGAPTSGNVCSVASAYLSVALVAGDTIAVTFAHSSACQASVVEYSGLSPVSRTDQTVDSPTNTPAGSVTAATAVAGAAPFELAVCSVACGAVQTFSVTNPDPDSGGTWTPLHNASLPVLDTAYQIIASGAQVSCTWTITGSVALDAVLVTYKALQGSDAGTGTDVGQVPLNAPQGAETATGVEGTPQIAVSDTDSFSGVDAGTVTAQVSGADLGTGTDAAPLDSDSFAATETQRTSVISGTNPIQFIQNVAKGSNGATTSTTVTLTLATGINTTQGHTLILYARGGGKNASVSSVTDSRSNTWTVDKTQTVTAGVAASLASTYLATALVAGDTITVTFAVTATFQECSAAEYSNIAAVGRLDRTAAVATNAVATSTGPVATTQPTQQTDEVACCVLAYSGGSQANTLTTADPASGGTWSDVGYAGGSYDLAYQLLSTETDVSCTWGVPTAADLTAVLATYRAGPYDTDTVSGADAGEMIRLTDVDAVSGADGGEHVQQSNPSDSDTFTGSDRSLSFFPSDSDSASGASVESVQHPNVVHVFDTDWFRCLAQVPGGTAPTDSDTGLFQSSETPAHATVPAADLFTGTEAVAMWSAGQVSTFWIHEDSSAITTATINTEAPRRALMVFNAWEYGYAAQFKAVNPHIKCYVYKDFSSARTNDPGPNGEYAAGIGQTYSWVNTNHPEWFLLNPSGAQMSWSGFPGSYQMDIGLAAYQSAWAAAVLADLQAHGTAWDGVFCDNALVSRTAYGINPAKYTTDSAFQAAYVSMISGTAPTITNAGFGMIANMAGARTHPGVWSSYVNAGLHGGFDEYWITTSSPGGELGEYGTPSQGAVAQMNEISGDTAVRAIGMGQPQSTSTDTQGFRYALAAYFLCGADGWSVFSEYNSYGPPPTWRTEYTWQLGLPQGAFTSVASLVYQRIFAHGMALLNANASGANVNVGLGGTYLDQDGNTVTTVSLAPLTGMVLRKISA